MKPKRRKTDAAYDCEGPPTMPTTYRQPDGRERQAVLIDGLDAIGVAYAFLVMHRHPGTKQVWLSIDGVKGALLVVLCALTLSACATSLQPPIVQEYTALLTDGDHVVLKTTVTAIYPFLTWTVPCGRRGLLTVSTLCPRVRTFRFTDLNRTHHIVIYTEVHTS